MYNTHARINHQNMCNDFNLQPQPGEIWKLKRLQINREHCQHQAPNYVMIVTEPEVVSDLPIVSVMLLSAETNFLSDVDLLIPASVSGFQQDLLALPWLVFPMFIHDLAYHTGARVSYQVYETLLSVGDYFHNLVEQSPSNLEIESLGLKKGTLINNDILKAFHHQEQSKSNILSIPSQLLSCNEHSVVIATQILDEIVQVEQDLTDTILTNVVEITPIPLKTPVILSHWFESHHQPEWQISTQIPQLAVATRSRNYPEPTTISTLDEISTLIKQLSLLTDEYQRRSIATRLGEIGTGDQTAIQALVNLLQTTSDDETLWTAVESLWKIDPGNPAVGVRRVKIMDLGIQLAGEGVALAVALIPKINQRFGVLLQVYPTGREVYLPPELKLMLLDTTGKILRKVTAQLADVFIQLKFSGKAGEPFSVKVTLGEAEITENFVM